MKTLSGRSDRDLPTMSIKTVDDRRFSTSSRRMSMEMALHQASVEVYYAGAPVGVPFKWESQPGTPRVRFREIPLPPLTPPPSFLFNSPNNTLNKKNPTKPKGGILCRLTPTRKSYNSPVSPASSESSSLFSTWSYSDSASSPYTPKRENRRNSFQDQGRSKSPVSTLCFRIRRGK